MSSKIWAVGMRDWVELRESKDAPRPKVSSAKKSLEKETIRIPIYDDRGMWTGRRETKTTASSLVMKMVTFDGGKVKATLKRRSFTERTGIPLREGDVREVPPDLANILIADDWSQKIPQELGGPR